MEFVTRSDPPAELVELCAEVVVLVAVPVELVVVTVTVVCSVVVCRVVLLLPVFPVPPGANAAGNRPG